MASNKYAAMCATGMMTLSDSQLRFIRRDIQFDAIDQSRMPLELVELIESVLVQNVSGLPVEEQHDVLVMAFEDFMMGERENFDAYVARPKQI